MSVSLLRIYKHRIGACVCACDVSYLSGHVQPERITTAAILAVCAPLVRHQVPDGGVSGSRPRLPDSIPEPCPALHDDRLHWPSFWTPLRPRSIVPRPPPPTQCTLQRGPPCSVRSSAPPARVTIYPASPLPEERRGRLEAESTLRRPPWPFVTEVGSPQLSVTLEHPFPGFFPLCLPPSGCCLLGSPPPEGGGARPLHCPPSLAIKGPRLCCGPCVMVD